MLRQAQQNGKANGGGTGIKKRRRHMRAILKEGLEAALRANPEVVENCKPKTFAGKLVRGMLIEAAKAKTTPLKQVMSLIDWEPENGDEDIAEIPDDTEWDWTEEGEWVTKPEAVAKAEPIEDDEGERARAELKRRLTRLVETGQHEHAARIVEAIRSGQYGEPQPVSSG